MKENFYSLKFFYYTFAFIYNIGLFHVFVFCRRNKFEFYDALQEDAKFLTMWNYVSKF